MNPTVVFIFRAVFTSSPDQVLTGGNEGPKKQKTHKLYIFYFSSQINVQQRTTESQSGLASAADVLVLGVVRPRSSHRGTSWWDKDLSQGSELKSVPDVTERGAHRPS